MLLHQGSLLKFDLRRLLLQLLNLELQLDYHIRKTVQLLLSLLPLELDNHALRVFLVVPLLRRLGCLNEPSVGRLDLGIAVQDKLVNLLEQLGA